jgi:esterase/lipase superfamily enzyme
MGAIFEGGLVLVVLLCAVVVIGANAALYRWTAGRPPAIRRAAQLVLPVLLLSATMTAASFRAPAPETRITRATTFSAAGAIPHRLAWTAESARRLVEMTQPAATNPVVTGTLRPKAPSGIAGRMPPPNRHDVVQVFYGTDRTRADKPRRIAYGSDRAQRLELGRALVTIPTAHLAPASTEQWSIKRPYFGVALRDQAEDTRTHFTVSQIATLTRDEMLQLVTERLQASKDYKDHALVFIHGYNNDFDHALYRTAQIAYDLKFDGAAFMYSWPSGGSFTTYTYDRDSARQTMQYLRDFIDLAVMESGARNVSVIAHGMGSQPLLSVLSDLRREAPSAPRIHQLILAAPDIDRDAFEIVAGQIKGISTGITLYASSSDLALGVSRRFGGDIARAGDVGEGGPAIVAGIDSIDISTLNTAFFAMNHATYAEQSALIQDIERLLLTGARPPDRRLPILKRITGPAGVYWRHP